MFNFIYTSFSRCVFDLIKLEKVTDLKSDWNAHMEVSWFEMAAPVVKSYWSVSVKVVDFGLFSISVHFINFKLGVWHLKLKSVVNLRFSSRVVAHDDKLSFLNERLIQHHISLWILERNALILIVHISHIQLEMLLDILLN